MALLDLIGRQGALRITWELRDGARTFRELRTATELSSGALTNRLFELREALIIIETEVGYALTREGRALMIKHVVPMISWSERWAKRLDASKS